MFKLSLALTMMRNEMTVEIMKDIQKRMQKKEEKIESISEISLDDYDEVFTSLIESTND